MSVTLPWFELSRAISSLEGKQIGFTHDHVWGFYEVPASLIRHIMAMLKSVLRGEIDRPSARRCDESALCLGGR